MVKKENNKRKGSAGNNRKLGEDFLKSNALKQGVVETSTGLQYSIVEQSTGELPTPHSKIIIHQRALLLNGNILEDTYRLNKPDELAINELIEGLQEGILMMPKGSRYKFWVPAELAWGKKGTGNKIPPNAVLVFDIRLVDFN